MKQKILLAAGLLFSLFAQNNVFAQDAKGFIDVKGSNVLNAGVGLGSYDLAGTGGLPITASFEHGFTKNISAGVNAGFIRRTYFTDWKYTYLVFGARGSYHLNETFKISNPKLDVYTGAGLLYRRFSVRYTGHTGDDEPSFALHLGGRYFFNPQVGAFAELGYGISPLQLGVSLKF
jgi:hypothetical protein